jgi:hypothetical protein
MIREYAELVTKGTSMKHLHLRTSESASEQAYPPNPPQGPGQPSDRFGGPERDLYPRERFHAALNGEMTPEEYVADVQAFVDARIAQDHTSPSQKKN